MGFKRKEFENRKLERLSQKTLAHTCVGGGSYYNGRKCRYVRVWKSNGRKSCWAKAKKRSHKVYRIFIRENDFYSPKSYDIYWEVW